MLSPWLSQMNETFESIHLNFMLLTEDFYFSVSPINFLSPPSNPSYLNTYPAIVIRLHLSCHFFLYMTSQYSIVAYNNNVA